MGLANRLVLSSVILGNAVWAQADPVYTPPKDFTARALIQVLNRHPEASTMEQALRLLPQNIRENIAWQYYSVGLQGATADLPRTFVFDENVRFILTFAGDEKMGRGNHWEIMQYSERKGGHAKFDLYDVEFPLRRNIIGQVRSIRHNPAECLSCHGQRPKALFGAYESWSGFFFDSAGAFTAAAGPDTPLESINGMEEVGKEITTVGQADDAFFRFHSRLPANARYGALLPRPGSLYSPYLDGKTDPSHPGAHNSAIFEFLPTRRLSNMLTRLNSRYFLSRAKESRYYQDLLPVLALHLNRASTETPDPKNPGKTIFKPMGPMECGLVESAHPEFGWTDQDVAWGNQLIQTYYTQHGMVLPRSDKSGLSIQNLLGVLGLKGSDLTTRLKSRANLPDVDPEKRSPVFEGVFDGETWIASIAQFQELQKYYPFLKDKLRLKTYSLTDYYSGIGFKSASARDRYLLKSWDAAGVRGHLTSGTDCAGVYRAVREGLHKFQNRLENI